SLTTRRISRSGYPMAALISLPTRRIGHDLFKVEDEWNLPPIRICISRSAPAVILLLPATSFACARVARRAKYRRKTTRNQTFSSSVAGFGRSYSCTIPRLPKRNHSRAKDCPRNDCCFFSEREPQRYLRQRGTS